MFLRTGRACRSGDPQTPCGTSSQTQLSAWPPHRLADRRYGPECFRPGTECCRCPSPRRSRHEKRVSDFFSQSVPSRQGNAPAAAFVLVKTDRPQCKFHHARLVVDHYHASRAQHRPGLAHLVEIHAQVLNLLRQQHRCRRTAGHDGLQFASATHASRHIVDDLSSGCSPSAVRIRLGASTWPLTLNKPRSPIACRTHGGIGCRAIEIT